MVKRVSEETKKAYRRGWHADLPQWKKPEKKTVWTVKLTVKDVQNLDKLRCQPEFHLMDRIEVFRRLVACYKKE